MKQQNVKYEILCEIEHEKAHVQLGFKFEDYFETSVYYLVSESYGYHKGMNIPFEVVKDGDVIGKVNLVDNDVSRMMEEFLSLTEDHDFNKIVIKNHRDSVTSDIINFFENYRKTIIDNKNTLVGEIKRMKAVAGIL